MQFITKFKINYKEEILELRNQEKKEIIRREMDRIKWSKEKERDLCVYKQILNELSETEINEIKKYWVEKQESIDDEYIRDNK
jgi:cytochrome c553